MVKSQSTTIVHKGYQCNHQAASTLPFYIVSHYVCVFISVMFFPYLLLMKCSSEAPWASRTCETWLCIRQMQVPGWIEWHWGYKVSTLPVNLNSLLIHFLSYKWPQWGQSPDRDRERARERERLWVNIAQENEEIEIHRNCCVGFKANLFIK